MEINEQLFEDVLSGKLKGTFVLRNKQIVKSNTLKRNYNDNFPYKLCITYDNGITAYGTFKSNGDFETINKSYFDIIDFIPETNMKENELIIEIPNNKVVDWDESKKQNKIVLKDKPNLSYGDVCRKLFGNQQHYHITHDGHVEIADFYRCDTEPNAAETRHQLECILAKNKLATVAKYLNDGWKPNEDSLEYYINNYHGNLLIYWSSEGISTRVGQIIFKSKELAKQAIEILGEETIKLALEPLGI